MPQTSHNSKLKICIYIAAVWILAADSKLFCWEIQFFHWKKLSYDPLTALEALSVSWLFSSQFSRWISLEQLPPASCGPSKRRITSLNVSKNSGILSTEIILISEN